MAGGWGAGDAETPEGGDPSALLQRLADIGHPGPGERVGGGQRARSWSGPLDSTSEREARVSSPQVFLLTLVTPEGEWHPQLQTLPVAFDVVASPWSHPVCRGCAKCCGYKGEDRVSAFPELQLAVGQPRAQGRSWMGLVPELRTEQWRWEALKKEVEAASWGNSSIISS